MINDELLGYIRGQLSQKVPRESISANLRGAGWAESDIAEGFQALAPAPSPVMPSVVTPAPVSSPASSVFPIQPAYTEHKPKNMKIVVGIFVLLLVLAGGASAYGYYSGLFVNFPTLEKQAIENAHNAKTANFDATIDVDFSDIKSDSLGSLSMFGINSKNLVLTTKGSYDVNDGNNPKVDMNLSLTLGTFYATGEIRALDNTLYGTITKMPAALSLLPLSISPSKWFSYPYKAKQSDISNNGLPGLSTLYPNIQDNLTDEQKEHIYELGRDAHLIKQVKKLPMETVGGESSYHFSFDLDREGMLAYLQATEDYIKTSGKDNSALSVFDTSSLKKGLDTIKDFQGEIWIGKSDKMTHKITMNCNIQLDATKDEVAKVSVAVIMSGWNQPVTIVAPVDSTPLESLVQTSLDDAREKGKEAAIKAELSMIRTEAELHYDSAGSYLGFCSSKELKTAEQYIKTNGEGTSFVCHDTSTKYVASAKFPQGGAYWCVDNSGVSKQTSSSPTSLVCPNN